MLKASYKINDFLEMSPEAYEGITVDLEKYISSSTCIDFHYYSEQSKTMKGKDYKNIFPLTLLNTHTQTYLFTYDGVYYRKFNIYHIKNLRKSIECNSSEIVKNIDFTQLENNIVNAKSIWFSELHTKKNDKYLVKVKLKNFALRHFTRTEELVDGIFEFEAKSPDEVILFALHWFPNVEIVEPKEWKDIFHQRLNEYITG